jgi:CO/xanthine dehydrogenase FAD-binding subunit
LLVEPTRHAIDGSLLVDLAQGRRLAGIEREPDGGLRIGAMTTLAVLADERRRAGDCTSRSPRRPGLDR